MMSNPSSLTAAAAEVDGNHDGNHDDPWWKSALLQITGYACDEDVTTLKNLHKRASSQYYKSLIDKETFDEICFLTWMDSWNWFAYSADFTPMLCRTNHNENQSMVQWMIPQLPDDEIPCCGSSKNNSNNNLNEQDFAQLRFQWMEFWKRYSNTCRNTCAPSSSSSAAVATTSNNRKSRPLANNNSNNNNSKSNKRIKLMVALGGSDDSFNEGSCALPFAFRMLQLLFYSHQSLQGNWEEFHNQGHRSIEKYLKTFTHDDIQAALCLFGLDCLYNNYKIPGLTPSMILQKYISPFG